MSILKKPDNRVLYFIFNTLYTTGFMFCSGTVLHTFMLSAGMSDAEVSAYSAVTQFVQAVVIFMMAFYADKIRKALKLYIAIVLSVALISVSLVVCVFIRSDVTAVKILIFASSVIVYFLMGVRNGIDYRIVYELFDMNSLGKLMGAAIAVSGVVSFGASMLYSYTAARFDYYDVMTVFFILSALMIIGSAIVCASYKKINEMPVAEKRRGLDLSAFKNRTTRALALPSLFRGFANGIIVLITVAGFSGGILDIRSSTYVSIITQAATFLGNIAFAMICRRMSNKTSLLLSSILMAVAMPISVLHSDLAEFLTAYAFAYFAYMIVSIAIPMLACEIIPYEQIGSFTCIRMMLFTLGSVIASVAYKPLADLVGFFALFAIGGVFQALCGVMHYFVARRAEREKEAEKEAAEA